MNEWSAEKDISLNIHCQSFALCNYRLQAQWNNNWRALAINHKTKRQAHFPNIFRETPIQYQQQSLFFGS